jgi:hypothetical protein
VSTIRLRVSGQFAELSDTASGADLDAWARAHFPRVRPDRLKIVFRQRFVEPSDVLVSLGAKEDEWFSVVEDRCGHGSPYDPETGHYECGWC